MNKATNCELSNVGNCLLNTSSKAANEKFTVWAVAPFCMKQLCIFSSSVNSLKKCVRINQTQQLELTVCLKTMILTFFHTLTAHQTPNLRSWKNFINCNGNFLNTRICYSGSYTYTININQATMHTYYTWTLCPRTRSLSLSHAHALSLSLSLSLSLTTCSLWLTTHDWALVSRSSTNKTRTMAANLSHTELTFSYIHGTKVKDLSVERH